MDHQRQRAQARHDMLRAQRQAADRPVPDLGKTPASSMQNMLAKARADRAAAAASRSVNGADEKDLKSRVGAILKQ